MKTRQEIKAMAKVQVKGKIGILFVVNLVIIVLSALASLVLSLIPFVGSLANAIIITPAFAISSLRIYQNLAKSVEPSVSDTFSGFDDFWSGFKATFMVGLFTFLWSLLFVIPGIIKSFSYSQTMYIVAENNGISALEAINRSKAMMEGKKMELFVLGLSFIGWGLLCAITFGIAAIWVAPYLQATLVNFYNEVKPVEVIPAIEEPITQA